MMTMTGVDDGDDDDPVYNYSGVDADYDGVSGVEEDDDDEDWC